MRRKTAAEVATYSDSVTHVLDEALSRAESRLQRLLDPVRTGFEAMTPADIADAFARHVAAVNGGKDTAF
jgi:hypothetical protein